MLGLISIVFLLKKDLLKSTLFFTTSILFKPSLVVFLPIMSIIWVLQKHQIKDWAISFLASSSLIILVSFWFHSRLDFPIWLINLYSQKILPGEIGYLTANAFNLWYLINPGKVLDSTKFLGIQARIIGYLLWSAVVLIVLIKSKKELTKEKKIFMLLAISSLSAFLFFTRIHERYLYPFFPITTILIGFMPEMITAYVTLSAVFLLNMYNLFWAPGIPFLQNTLSNTQTPIVLSFINLLIFGLVFILGIIRKK
jgi:hypothetical protein